MEKFNMTEGTPKHEKDRADLHPKIVGLQRSLALERPEEGNTSIERIGELVKKLDEFDMEKLLYSDSTSSASDASSTPPDLLERIAAAAAAEAGVCLAAARRHSADIYRIMRQMNMHP